jgi:glycosyltransferase involved in cell wall biosynthesis
MTTQNTSPRVSVLLNCYNQAEWVAEAIESVFKQTFTDFELIVVDNGSTDKTPQVLKSFASDPRVRLFLHEENAAVSKRFNQAVDASRGEFISFLYSDDYYLPHKLQRQLEIFEGLGPEYGVVYGPSLVKNEITGEMWEAPCIRFSGAIFRDLCLHLEQGPPNMIAPMTRRSCLARYRFYEDIFAEGEAIYFRIATSQRFHFDPEPLSVVRDHMRNAGKAIKVNTEIFDTCMQRLITSGELGRQDHDVITTVRAIKLRDVGWTAIRTNESAAWARECYRRAVRLRTRELLHPRLLAGTLMSWIPAPLRAKLNGLADRARGVRINSVVVEGYGGTQESR